MRRNPRWKAYATLSIGLILVTTTIAFISRLWVVTAIPIGFLFGFFLQKGDLCGASAFSEVLLAKDWRKVQGLWACIVVSMIGFAILDGLGLVTLNVKPMFWLNYVVGGLLFGSGMGHSDNHTVQRIPMILAGKGGGFLKTGRYLRYSEK